MDEVINEIKLPFKFYERLYNAIIHSDIEINNLNYNFQQLSIDIEEFNIDIDVYFEVKEVDLSFDHLFGTRHEYEIVIGDIEDISVNYLWYYDSNKGKMHNVTYLFDENQFWLQFKQFVIKRNGRYIKYGDQVMVKKYPKSRIWEKRIFLYYDTRIKKFTCACFYYRNKLKGKEQFEFLKPLD